MFVYDLKYQKGEKWMCSVALRPALQTVLTLVGSYTHALRPTLQTVLTLVGSSTHALYRGRSHKFVTNQLISCGQLMDFHYCIILS